MASGDGTPRTYSIATETANGVVNGTLLKDEIEADAGITTALSHINTAGDVLDIYFTAALGAPEITALDAVVLAHQGTSTVAGFQFWEDNSAFATTAQTWQTAMSRTASALGNGVYILTWRFELRLDPTGPVNSKAAGRFAIDGNIKGNTVTVENDWVSFSGWDRFVAAEGETPVLELEVRRDPTVGGNDTVEIRKMKMGIQRMEEEDT